MSGGTSSHLNERTSKNMKPITKQIREIRRRNAEIRQQEYDKLTVQEKLDRLPIGGANKQRARLLKGVQGH